MDECTALTSDTNGTNSPPTAPTMGDIHSPPAFPPLTTNPPEAFEEEPPPTTHTVKVVVKPTPSGLDMEYQLLVQTLEHLLMWPLGLLTIAACISRD